MYVRYRVYRSAVAGGPVDFSAPVATTPGTSVDLPPPGPGAWSFVVRAFDPATGLEDLGATPATVEVDGSGADVTGRPAAPAAFACRLAAAGSVAASWAAADQHRSGPTSFRLWSAPAGQLDLSGPPARVVGAQPGRGLYSARVPVAGPGPWDLAIVARNPRGDSGPRAASVAAATVPAAVDPLP